MDRNNAYARRDGQETVKAALAAAGDSRRQPAREWSAFLSLCFFLSNFRAEARSVAPDSARGTRLAPGGRHHGSKVAGIGA